LLNDSIRTIVALSEMDPRQSFYRVVKNPFEIIERKEPMFLSTYLNKVAAARLIVVGLMVAAALEAQLITNTQ